MSYSAMRPDGVAQLPAIGAAPVARLDFLKQVYALTFAGILFFCAVVALPIYGTVAGIGFLESIFNMAVQIHPMISLLVLIGSSFVVHSVAMTKGINVIALFFFSAVWGIVTIPLVAYAIAATGGVGVVFQALGLTCIVFGGLTSYVLLTRKDFSFMGASLAMGSFLILGVIVITLIASMMGYSLPFMSLGISIFLAILFSGYVLYDTSNILHHYATDMVVPGALALMVDFIILFRSILIILISSRR